MSDKPSKELDTGAGKGSARRKSSDIRKYHAGWERALGKPKRKQKEKR